MKKFIFAFIACLYVGRMYGADLVGSAYVSMTSDTSSAAKTMAMNDARRQILVDKLSSYTMSDQLKPAIRGAKNTDLEKLVSETTIDNEKISDTAYSAKITMTIDKVAAKSWLTENEVQNWLNDGTTTDMFVAQITLGNNAVDDWSDFNRIMRHEHVDATTKYIVGNKVTVELPRSLRGAITIALRSGGWRTATNDDILKIWKQ